MTPVTITAENLKLTVGTGPSRKLKKHILRDVSCELTGLVGVVGKSGSGKTTLVNMLAGRVSLEANVSMEGQVLVNGKQLKADKVREISKMVPQTDVLIPQLTPLELMRYQARMCLSGLTDLNHEEEINRTVSSLQLENCIHTPSSALSGGEKRRVSVALELLTRPSILFLDEITSGLDSSSAMNVMETIEKLVRRKACTVVCIIHQPSTRIAFLFHRLLVLEAGRVVYEGSLTEMNNFLCRIGHPCPKLVNPIEFLLETIDQLDNEIDVESGIACTEEGFPQKQSKTNKSLIHEGDFASPLDPERRDVVPNTVLFRVLVGRTTKALLRNGPLLRAKMVGYMLIGFLVGTTFLLIPATQSYSGSFMSVLFMASAQNTFNPAVSALSELPVEIALFRREYANGTYPIHVWWAARNLVTYTYQLVFCVLFSVVVYFLTGLYSSVSGFFIFLAAVVILAFTSVSIAFMLGAGLRQPELAMQFVTVVFFIPLIYTGFIISPADIPVWYSWVMWLSFIRYAYAILVMNQFDTGFEFAYCNTTTTTVCPYGEGTVSGSVLVESGGYNTVPIYACFLVLLGMWVVFVVLGGFILNHRAHRGF